MRAQLRRRDERSTREHRLSPVEQLVADQRIEVAALRAHAVLGTSIVPA
jgi:hypothetical protein